MIVKKVVDLERNRAKRRIKRSLVTGAILFCAGYMTGVHKKVIAAKIKGEELPDSPHRHCGHKDENEDE